MSIWRSYSYEVRKRYFCMEQPLGCDNPVRIEVNLRPISDDDPEMRLKATDIVPQSLLLSDDNAGPTLSSILSSVGIPKEHQTQLIEIISSQVRRLSFVETCPVCHRFLVPGVVSMIHVDESDIEDEISEGVGVDDIGEVTGELMPVEVFMPVPATESSIDELEKLDVGDDNSDSMDKCAICFEDFVGGSKVNRMPCSHVYHGDCIVTWLRTSHLCPLCRYQMPIT